MARYDRVEEWEAAGVLDEKLSLIRSLSMQGLNLTEIGKHEEINLSERHLKRLKKKHKNLESSIKKGRDYVVGFAQNALMKQVRDGNITAIIYALKVYGGEFFKENKLELQLQRAEYELRKKQFEAGSNKEDDKTIILNIKPATGLEVEQAKGGE